jgi:hypothetical protein
MLHLALCLVAMWCSLCRLNYMGRGTRHTVTLEYFVLGAASAALLLARSEPWVFVLLTLILLRFAFTSKYWKHCQPHWSMK